MELTAEQQQIMQGQICPYCKSPTKLIDSKEVYGTHYGYLWICRPCDAYVGCHPNTKRSLGRLANKELREVKKLAKEAFNELWKDGYMKRGQAYRWLSKAMELPEDQTHFGMFNIASCYKAWQLTTEKQLQLNQHK